MSAIPPPKRGVKDRVLAIDRVRAYIVLLVLACHSFLAYTAFAPAFRLEPFLRKPYAWVNYPMLDTPRWAGFDVFFLYSENLVLVTLFFVAGFFVASGLARKGRLRYLAGRLVRLGTPFAIAVFVLSPIAYFPSYAMREAHPGVADFLRSYASLDFWSAGPLWFVAVLFLFDLIVVAVHAVAPGSFAMLGRACAGAAGSPARFCGGVVAVALLGYLALCIAFGSRWITQVPFEQASRALVFLLWFVAGIGVGVARVHRALLAADGALARHWPMWLAASGIAFAAYLACWVAIESAGAERPVAWLAARNVAHLVFGAAAGFFALGFCARVAGRPSALLASVSANGFGMYLVHYPFATWSQFALLGVALPALVKGLAAFAFTALGSWALVAALRYLAAALRPTADEGALVPGGPSA